MEHTATISPSSARCLRSLSTTLPTSPTPRPSTITLPAGTSESCFILSSCSSRTLPISPIKMSFLSMPMAIARPACFCRCFCSPWTGMKNLGFTSPCMSFNSS